MPSMRNPLNRPSDAAFVSSQAPRGSATDAVNVLDAIRLRTYRSLEEYERGSPTISGFADTYSERHRRAPRRTRAGSAARGGNRRPTVATSGKFWPSSFAALAAVALVIARPNRSCAQRDLGPKVEKTYGAGLPRDGDRLVFSDSQYPFWPLTADQKKYGTISGARMKREVVDLAQMSLRYRDLGHQWWGRFPGTSADSESMRYMTKEFERLGLKVEHFPYVLPRDWRPTEWSLKYRTRDGSAINLVTAFPVSGTKATGPEGITADAVWVGLGSGADFIDRDVKGKAVIIYSIFVPGGRSHSASDRARLFNSNARAVQMGAAMVIDVMGVPGNGQFQPEDGLTQVPQFTLSQDEGFALRDRLDRGEKIQFTAKLIVPELKDVATEYTIATLPGVSDEQIVVMTHTDGYFQAAMDNAAGMASALELARFYAARDDAAASAHDEVHSVSGSSSRRSRSRASQVRHRRDVSVGQGGREADDGASVTDAAVPVQRWTDADERCGRLSLECARQPGVRGDGVQHPSRIRRIGVRRERWAEERQLRALLSHHRSCHLSHNARHAGARASQWSRAGDARVRSRPRSGERDEHVAVAWAELSDAVTGANGASPAR